MSMSPEAMKKVKRLLYLNMLQYTKGEAHAKMVSGGIEEALEGYRFIVHKGKNATLRTLMDKRTKVMNPTAAKDVKEIEKKLMAWKSDCRYLKEMNNKQDIVMFENQEQMITILITMMRRGCCLYFDCQI